MGLYLLIYYAARLVVFPGSSRLYLRLFEKDSEAYFRPPAILDQSPLRSWPRSKVSAMPFSPPLASSSVFPALCTWSSARRE